MRIKILFTEHNLEVFRKLVPGSKVFLSGITEDKSKYIEGVIPDLMAGWVRTWLRYKGFKYQLLEEKSSEEEA